MFNVMSVGRQNLDLAVWMSGNMFLMYVRMSSLGEERKGREKERELEEGKEEEGKKEK